jgi:ribosomal subunit interface protein
MNIIITTKNLDLSDTLKDHVEEKFKHLEKFVGELKAMPDFFVELEKETTHHEKGDVFWCKASWELPGTLLVAKAHGDDLLATVMEAREEMEMELRKRKTQKIDNQRRKQKDETEPGLEAAIEEELR